MELSKRELAGHFKRGQAALGKLQLAKCREFERGYRGWSKEETVSWILSIDNHRFSTVHKYSKFRKMLNRSGICGVSLHELKSELFLKYVKLGVASRTALIDNINRLLSGGEPEPTDEEDGDTKMMQCADSVDADGQYDDH